MPRKATGILGSSGSAELLSLRRCSLRTVSVEYPRRVLSAGGGPLEVSIPWLLRDAGARRLISDRASRHVETSWTANNDFTGVDCVRVR